LMSAYASETPKGLNINHERKKDNRIPHRSAYHHTPEVSSTQHSKTA
jgi:hypothetical protein